MSRDLALLVLSLATWGVGEGMFFYFQPVYLEQLGADPVLIGLLLGAYGVVMTVTHIPAGYLADRMGRKPLMFSAWMLGTLAAWAMALARSLPWFVVGMLLYGATIFVLAPLNSYVTAARGRLSVGRAITLVSAGFNLGAVVGPWLGGRIGERMGLQTTYLIAAVLFVVSTLIFTQIRAQPVEAVPIGHHRFASMRTRSFVTFLSVIFVATFAMVLPQALAPNFLQNERGLDLARIGWLYAISGVGVVSLSLVIGQLDSRRGFLLSQVAVGAFALLLWQRAGFPWYALGFFMLGGYKVARSLATAQVRALVNPAEMGMAYGVTETVGAAASALAPPLAGYLYGLNPDWMFAASLILTAGAWLAAAGLLLRGPSETEPERLSSLEVLGD